MGIDYLSKKSTQIPNTSVKVFDARTFEILPFTHRFIPDVNTLTPFDESNDQFLLCSFTGQCSVYSLMNGLLEMQQFDVLSLYSFLFLVQ